MGNLQAESGYNPINLENTANTKLGMTDREFTLAVDCGKYANFVKDGFGYGLAQWTYWNRKQNLLDMANKQNKSIGDLDLQLEYLWWEIHDYYTPIYNLMKNCTDITALSNYILEEWERPGVINDKVRQERAFMGKVICERFNK